MPPPTRGNDKSQVRQCLGFSTADFWSLLTYMNHRRKIPNIAELQTSDRLCLCPSIYWSCSYSSNLSLILVAFLTMFFFFFHPPTVWNEFDGCATSWLADGELCWASSLVVQNYIGYTTSHLRGTNSEVKSNIYYTPTNLPLGNILWRLKGCRLRICSHIFRKTSEYSPSRILWHC